MNATRGDSTTKFESKFKIRGLQQNNSNSVSPVAVPSAGYIKMSERWDLLHDLMGGTRRMREQSAKWLPREPNEEIPAYRIRLHRTALYNAFADTIQKLGSKPFSKPITFVNGEKLPDQLTKIEHDTDRSGMDITSFAQQVWEAGCIHGLTHILVDFPNLPGNITMGDEKKIGARPYFVHVPASDLIGWRSSRSPSGERVLTQIRIWEEVVVGDGDYGDCCANRVRVINAPRMMLDDSGEELAMPGTWELWEQDPKDPGTFKLIESGTHSYPGIPIVTVYFKQSGFMMGEPPLEDLAWLNLLHFQSMSDQRNILRVARVGMIAATGLSSNEVKAEQTIGPNSMFKSSSKDAKFYYVEHRGAGIEAGANDLKTLEERMEVMGLQPMVARSSSDTATGKKINEGRADSTVHRWVRCVQSGFKKAFIAAANMYPTPLTVPEDFEPDIFDDFAALAMDSSDAKLVLEVRKGGDITRKTFLEELKRRGVLSESVNIEDELEELETEAANANELMDNDQDPKTGDEDLDDED